MIRQPSPCPFCKSPHTAIHTLIPKADEFDAIIQCDDCNRKFVVPYVVEETYGFLDDIDPVQLTAQITKGMV